jgi:sugar phosphate permease
LNFVNPLMLKDPTLGVNLTMIGGITSLLPVAYAFSKGISGFLGSTMSPRLLLSFGLASTGLACLGFGIGSAPLWFAVFWALNGLLQVWRNFSRHYFPVDQQELALLRYTVTCRLDYLK